MNEVNARRARLQLGWVTVFGSLNRVPASAGVKAGMSPLPGGRCVIPCGM